MYRSCLIRDCQPFYDDSLLHEDTEKCMQILRQWDFAFVHQVLSFLRTDNVNESISRVFQSLQPIELDRYIIVQRYAPLFLDASEAAALRKESKRGYYRMMAREALRFRDSAFWRYHRGGLKTLAQTLDRPYLALEVGRELLRLAANPGTTAVRALDYWKREMGRKKTARS